MTNSYHSPDGQWLSSATAKRQLMLLADDLDEHECHDRARYVRRNWQAVAARPSQWRDLARFAVTPDEMNRTMDYDPPKDTAP